MRPASRQRALFFSADVAEKRQRQMQVIGGDRPSGIVGKMGGAPVNNLFLYRFRQFKSENSRFGSDMIETRYELRGCYMLAPRMLTSEPFVSSLPVAAILPELLSALQQAPQVLLKAYRRRLNQPGCAVTDPRRRQH